MKKKWIVVQYHPRSDSKATKTEVFPPGTGLPGGNHWDCVSREDAEQLKADVVRNKPVRPPDMELIEIWDETDEQTDGWPLQCTPTFVEMFRVPDDAEQVARQFVDLGLEKLKRYAAEDPGGLHGKLTYVFRPRNPTESDVIVQFDYDQEIVVVGLEDDAYETDGGDPEDRRD